jgi:hypothetical protein
VSSLDDQAPLHACPVRDLGRNFQPHSPDDPWRRMPKLFELLRSVIGPYMHQRTSAVRLGIEREMRGHSEKVREIYGEPCSLERQRVCAGLMLGTLQGIRENDPERFAIVRHRLATLLDDGRAHAELERTRPEVEVSA